MKILYGDFLKSDEIRGKRVCIMELGYRTPKKHNFD
jgi:hypothetical protein